MAEATAGKIAGMPQGGDGKKAVPPAAGDRGSRSINSLPDGALEHIISFLPAEEAVQTSVLASRWRHLWKSATGLRIGCRDDGEPGPVKEHREFVDHLLLLRGGSPLYYTCEIKLGQFQADDMARINLWFRHAVQCKVRVLRLRIFSNLYLPLDDLPLVAQRLTRLELHGVQLNSTSMDFSSCPAMDHLELIDCGLTNVKKIVSESVKHLSIISCFDDSCYERSRVRVCVPKLISLRLGEIDRTPILDSMPLLVEAFVRVNDWRGDMCRIKLEPADCSSGANKSLVCGSSGNVGTGRCTSFLLLHSLSEAMSLVLNSVPDVIVFRGDSRWCPIFRNLKTLLLDDYWCVPDEFNALACILEHSPVLEKLTLQLFSEGPHHNVEMKWGCSMFGPSATISEHLDIVEIKCEVVDEMVLKVLEFLSTFNICKLTCNSPTFLTHTIGFTCVKKC
ncbi:hypothetical protein EJB05_28659, partial [Eragrostis curvula]